MINENKLLRVIASGLDVELSELSLSTKSSDLAQWDSLGHLSLLMKLDEEFDNLTEKVPEIASASSVEEILNLINKNLIT
tara:strand:- start:135 stop:374 length:240 start_codon:yes stop_codon:yes gene_type:complete